MTFWAYTRFDNNSLLLTHFQQMYAFQLNVLMFALAIVQLTRKKIEMFNSKPMSHA